MYAIREEVHRLVEALSYEEMAGVRDFLNVLMREPLELTDEEWQEVSDREEEFRKGEWLRWEDVIRTDV